MFIVRSVNNSDIDSLYELSSLVTFINLPHDREIITALVNSSVRSFNSPDKDKSKNYYVYCHSGVRSVQACQIMKTFGFNNLYNLLGGISEWTGQKNK